jgi:RNA ligase (TIGR02306 family)
MERKLATLRVIKDIKPIQGADAIELAIVDGWQVVVAKSVGHKVGNLIVYCEIDSFLPIREEFEFLRKSSYKKMGDGTEGFRLKTIKLRGQISQGLVLPISVLDGPDEMKVGISKQPWGDQLQLGPYDDALVIEEGVEVSQILGIVKYEPPIPAELAGKVKGGFPSFLRKTDEERIQNLANQYDKLKDNIYYITEKLDGSSATYYVNNGVFGVCSRNLELSRPEEFVPGMITCADGIDRPKQENSFWKVARELDIENKMLSLNANICFQGELIGEGIQGNPYNIKGQTVRFFNAYNIDTQEYFPMLSFEDIMRDLKLDTVPILETGIKLPYTIEDLLLLANGKSALNDKTMREGLVIRSHDRKVSFKVISNDFLLKEK